MQSGIELFTRGDDLGSSSTANKAIMEAYKKGILRNTSLMACCSYVHEAADMFANEKGICIGLHVTLNAEWDGVKWGPVLPVTKVPNLVDDHGYFYQTTQELYEIQPPIEEIFAEVNMQLDLATRLGFDIKYADTHMAFTWINEDLKKEFVEWCDRKGLVHMGYGFKPVPSEGEGMERLQSMVKSLENIEPGRYIIVGHPAYDTSEIRAYGHKGYEGDKVAKGRDVERQFFTHPDMLKVVEERGIRICRFDELA